MLLSVMLMGSHAKTLRQPPGELIQPLVLHNDLDHGCCAHCKLVVPLALTLTDAAVYVSSVIIIIGAVWPTPVNCASHTRSNMQQHLAAYIIVTAKIM